MLSTQDVKIQLASNQNKAGNVFCFTLTHGGFIGLFSIAYSDTSRKNATYRSLRAMDVYFEGTSSGTRTAYLHDVTDAMLFVERKKDWILGQLESENNKISL